jgi:ectoine hydroxylase-related dioxygenase (phytanoyl-CoA dioxygenase family)
MQPRNAPAIAHYRAVLDAAAQCAGIRELFAAVPETRELVNAANLAALIAPIVGADARIVRALLFNKSRAANWRVPWHQDLFVATASMANVPGFSAWTLKHGVHHARAPREVLERMLAIRIHIDDSNEADGPLRVLPGTHRHGVLDGLHIEQLSRHVTPSVCIASSGSVLLMRPLLLHASSPARSPAHRRVVHLEVADCELPRPLQWHQRLPL